jgi:proton-translocating NADH-quinone oxidoreductase chain N
MASLFILPLDVLVLFTVLTPFVGWLSTRLKRRFLVGIFASIGLIIAGIALYSMYAQVLSSAVPPGPQSLQQSLFSSFFRVDMLSFVMAAVFIGIGLSATVYSIRYMERDSGLSLYFTLVLSMITGLVGVSFAGDLFTLYVFWELMSISSYVLVAFRKEEWEPVEAGFKYLVMSAAASATLLFGIALLYGMTGTLSFQALALNPPASNPWLFITSLFVLVGFGVKAAIVPLHTWLPDAHSAAPTPISALLSGIVIETGVYALVRTYFTAFLSIQAQWFWILAFLSILTMTVGNLMALLQTDVKRLLAYSSIAQVGYMLVGFAVGTQANFPVAVQTGLTGTILHIINHSLMKGVAFMCAGAIILRIETRSLQDMSGIARKMPITATLFAISLFALVGMPPLNGFISELTLFTSSVQANVGWLGVAIILNSILSAGYYLRVLRAMVQPKVSDVLSKVKEAPITMLIPIGVMVALIVIFGVYPESVIKLAQQAAQGLLSMGGA